MKTLITKFEWLLWLITITPSVLLYLQWQQIPQRIPTHYNLFGQPDVWGDKSVLLWIIPFVSLFLYLLFLVIPLIDPKSRIERMGNKYFVLRLLLLSFIAGILIAWIYATTVPSKAGFTLALFPILSVYLIILGNYLQTIQPNYFIGIRTPWTLQNEKIWQATHRLGGRIYMVGGVLLLLGTLIFGHQGFNYFFLPLLLMLVLIPFFYSLYLFFITPKNV